MLQVEVITSETYDDERNEFFEETYALGLEHSLRSLSKWESMYEKPFLTDDEKTPEEMLDYIKCMTVKEDTPSDIYLHLSRENIREINEYIGSKQTATWFKDDNKKASREIITSELIYYWMFSYNIPMECEEWFLNKLLTLIKVFSVKNSPQKKKSQAEIAAENRAMNDQRRAKMNSKG